MALREIMLVHRVSYDFASSGMGLREFPRYRELHGELGASLTKLSANLKLYCNFSQFKVSLRINDKLYKRNTYQTESILAASLKRLKKKKKNLQFY